MTITPQTNLDERYLLLRRLAFGGMGEVWEGTDVVLDRSVAVKILRAELADDDAFRRRFRAEARTAGRVPHPGIAAVFDYGETSVDGKGLAYLVMELVPGEALSAVLAREGALGTDRTLDVVAQAARALQAAHERGVIHRDVKPANLLVTPDGRVKVTDFGIARPDDHEPLTATGQVMGTAHYLAPELARGRAATPASDIYALGVVMYECLAGRRPFEGDDQIGVATAHLSEEPPPLPGTIAPEVRALVAAAMEKDPQRRIAAADTFAAAAEGLRLRPQVAGNGAAPTAAAGLGAAVFPGEQPAPYGPASWPPGAYPGAPPGSGGLPQPGTATPSGALLSGATPPGGPSLFEHPVTAALPMPQPPPGTGGVRQERRTVSLPLAALVGLVLLVLVGTAIAALRPDPVSPSPGLTPTPGTPARTGGTPGGATKAPSTGPGTSKETRPGGSTSTRSRSGSVSPTGRPTPSATVRPTPTPSATPPASTPAASGTEPVEPTPTPPTPTPTDEAEAEGGIGDIIDGLAGAGTTPASRVSRAAPATVDTGKSGST